MQYENEIWKPIKDTQGYYISNYGRIKKEIVYIPKGKQFQLKKNTGNEYVTMGITIAEYFEECEIKYKGKIYKREVGEIEGELWKPVPQWEAYEASNKGRVRSVDRTIEYVDKVRPRKGVIHSHSISKKGYHTIVLSQNNETLRIGVHRIVAMTWIANPENKPHINHIDSDPGNNCVENLEWCTIKENNRHAWNKRIPNREENIEKVVQMLKEGKSPRQIKEVINISGSKISTMKTAMISRGEIMKTQTRYKIK